MNFSETVTSLTVNRMSRFVLQSAISLEKRMDRASTGICRVRAWPMYSPSGGILDPKRAE